MFQVRLRSTAREFVGDRHLTLGPAARPWLSFWSCPLHGWHDLFRVPFTVHVWSPR